MFRIKITSCHSFQHPPYFKKKIVFIEDYKYLETHMGKFVLPQFWTISPQIK